MTTADANGKAQMGGIQIEEARTMESRTMESRIDVQGERLNNLDIISYGLGAGPATLTKQFKGTFFMPFLTDFAGLSIMSVGIWTSVATIWDAINDPLIGGIADRTNTKRWGKYRPHMMMGSIFLALVVALMFVVPDFSETGKLTYYVTLMCLFTVFNTQFTVPWQALNSVMSTEPNQRNLLLTARQFIGFMAAALTGIAFMPIVDSFQNEEQGWLAAALLVGAISIVTGLVCANGAKKRDYYMSIPTPRKIKAGSQLAIIFKNKSVICVSIMLGLVTLSNAISNALNVYYAKYVVNNMGLVAMLAVMTLILSCVTFPFVPLILKHFGKSRTLILGMLMMLSNALLLALAREKASILLILGTHFITGVGFLFANVSTLSMIPDCTDYTEYNFGTSQAGYINAVITFFRKVFTSFSTLMVGGLLGYVGYSQNPGTPQVMDMILNIKIISPIVIAAICLITLSFYPITSAYGKKMREELKISRAH